MLFRIFSLRVFKVSHFSFVRMIFGKQGEYFLPYFSAQYSIILVNS